jgi:hypothetical protein
MAWYYRVVFMAAAAIALWSFVRNELYYPFSKSEPEDRMPTWLARTVTGFLVILFVWLSFQK